METSAFLRITNELRLATLKLTDDFALQAQSQKLRAMEQELTDSIDRLMKNENMVLVVGEVKGGKSSFINAVMGKNLLPVEDEVATSQAIMLSNKDKEKFRLVFTDDSTTEITEEKLTEYACQKTVDENGGILMLNGKQLSHIEIDYPARFLPSNLTLVDTPGAGTLFSYHLEITQRFVPQADAVIYVLDAYKPILKSDLSFLEEILYYTPHVFFILTKIDIIDEWETVRKRNEEILKQHFESRISQSLRVWPVSNTQLLKASRKGNEKRAKRYLKISRFEELGAELNRFLYFVSGLVRTIEVLAGLKSYSHALHAILNGRLEALSAKNKDEIKQKLEELNHKKNLIKTNWGLEGQGTNEAITQMSNYLSTCKQNFWQLFEEDGTTFKYAVEKVQRCKTLKECRNLSKHLPEEISRTFLLESDKFFKDIHIKMKKDYQELAHWLSQEVAPYSSNEKEEVANFLEDIFKSPAASISNSMKRSWARNIKISAQKTISRLLLPTVSIFRMMDSVFNRAEKLERVRSELLDIARNSLNEIRTKCQTIDFYSDQTNAPIDNYFLYLQQDWKQRLNQLLHLRGVELDEEIKRLESQVNAAKDLMDEEIKSAAKALKIWQGLQDTTDKYLLKCNEICHEMNR
ncbi:MAG: dynamin family protein [Desulfobacteraceae bacterium]|jgi:GTPase Era involved in 16S rRNA processing